MMHIEPSDLHRSSHYPTTIATDFAIPWPSQDNTHRTGRESPPLPRDFITNAAPPTPPFGRESPPLPPDVNNPMPRSTSQPPPDYICYPYPPTSTCAKANEGPQSRVVAKTNAGNLAREKRLEVHGSAAAVSLIGSVVFLPLIAWHMTNIHLQRSPSYDLDKMDKSWKAWWEEVHNETRRDVLWGSLCTLVLINFVLALLALHHYHRLIHRPRAKPILYNPVYQKDTAIWTSPVYCTHSSRRAHSKKPTYHPFQHPRLPPRLQFLLMTLYDLLVIVVMGLHIYYTAWDATNQNGDRLFCTRMQAELRPTPPGLVATTKELDFRTRCGTILYELAIVGTMSSTCAACLLLIHAFTLIYRFHTYADYPEDDFKSPHQNRKYNHHRDQKSTGDFSSRSSLSLSLPQDVPLPEETNEKRSSLVLPRPPDRLPTTRFIPQHHRQSMSLPNLTRPTHFSSFSDAYHSRLCQSAISEEEQRIESPARHSRSASDSFTVPGILHRDMHSDSVVGGRRFKGGDLARYAPRESGGKVDAGEGFEGRQSSWKEALLECLVP